MEEVSRREIEERISNVGDYVKIDYLSRYLRKPLSFDTRKFVMVKLAGIYEARKMFVDAAKLMQTAADINTTFQGKIDDFVSSGRLFIKAGDYDNAEISFKRAGACANGLQKNHIKSVKKEFYKTQAKAHLEKDQRQRAMKTYEHLLQSGELAHDEKIEIQEKLLGLYEKLGKIRDYYDLKRMID